MLSAPCAEWILARLTNETQAASIIGDLLEDVPERGPEWFWFCVAGIVLSLTWRYLLALVVALLFRQILWYIPKPIFGGSVGPQPPQSLGPFFTALGYVCMVLWIAAPYAAIRYGLRDRFAQLALFICMTLSTSFLCWRMPGVLVGSLGLTSVLIITCLVFSTLRKPLFSISLTLGLGYATTQFTLALREKYVEWMPVSNSLSEQQKYLVILLSAAFVAAACELMHRIFAALPNRPQHNKPVPRSDKEKFQSTPE